MASFAPCNVQSDRLFPISPSCTEQTVALSLLDGKKAYSNPLHRESGRPSTRSVSPQPWRRIYTHWCMKSRSSGSGRRSWEDGISSSRLGRVLGVMRLVLDWESLRYVDELFPNMDGVIVIKEAPPKKARSDASNGNGSKRSWTDHGVDISVHIRDQDMEQLLKDPYLSP